MKKTIATAVLVTGLVGFLMVGNNNHTITAASSTTTAAEPEPEIRFNERERELTFSISGGQIVGKVNYTAKRVEGGKPDGWHLGGEFHNGTFVFSIQGEQAEGMVMLPEEGLVWILLKSPKSAPVWKLRQLAEVACAEMPAVKPEGAGAAAVATVPSVTTQAMVPMMNSKVGAKSTIMLDFVGGNIQDALWNGGKAFVASPANFTLSQLKQAYDVVAERYAAFDVNVTTDYAVYNATPVKRRMRAIFTTTDFITGYGGYAYIGSWRASGSGCYSSTVPCFVFVHSTGNAKNSGECAAHEVGHTLGLNHDGKTGAGATVYYAGQGNWAPVMGTSYSKAVVQWSKGDYALANNREDDINTIAQNIGAGTSGFCYASVNNAANPVVLNGSLAGVISNSSMSSYYTVRVANSGSLAVNVNVPIYGGLNSAVEVSSNGVLLGKSNLTNSLNSNLTLSVKPGVYTVRVSGEGEGDLSTGYSSYGSIGSYIVSGTLK